MNTLQSLLSDNGGNQPLLKDSQVRLVIPTFRAGESIPRLIKTPHSERYKYDWKLPMWAVGLATSAAPTYLPSFHFDDKTYLDGGLWANNPSLVGVVEAKDLGAKIENIRVLNIGTTFTRNECIYSYPLTKTLHFVRFRRSGVASWGAKILSTVMQANSYAISNMYLHQLLDRGHYFSINKQLDKCDGRLDKIDTEKFLEIGVSAGETHFSHLSEFFKHQAHAYVPNQKAMNHGN
jgi:hypothetical protein